MHNHATCGGHQFRYGGGEEGGEGEGKTREGRERGKRKGRRVGRGEEGGGEGGVSIRKYAQDKLVRVQSSDSSYSTTVDIPSLKTTR